MSIGLRPGIGGERVVIRVLGVERSLLVLQLWLNVRSFVRSVDVVTLEFGLWSVAVVWGWSLLVDPKVFDYLPGMFASPWFETESIWGLAPTAAAMLHVVSWARRHYPAPAALRAHTLFRRGIDLRAWAMSLTAVWYGAFAGAQLAHSFQAPPGRVYAVLTLLATFVAIRRHTDK